MSKEADAGAVGTKEFAIIYYFLTGEKNGESKARNYLQALTKPVVGDY